MKPLKGIRILDFTRVLAGPMATQILAELGAEVIKIERPGTGDESRTFEPRVAGGESAYFFAFNRAKRSLTLNLKSAAGQAIALRLAARADVVMENFLPGDMDALGLGYAAMSQHNPRLIYVSNTGFGQDGPDRHRKGYDTIFQALAGVMALTGYPDGPPAKVGLPFADLTSGLWNAIAVLTGLVGRATSGRGCHVDLAMLDIQISLLTIAAARLFALGEAPPRTGTEHPGRVPTAAFHCREGGWLHISGGDGDWQAICAVLDLTELASDPALARNKGRVDARRRVMDAMTIAVAQRDRDELERALITAGVPAGAVKTLEEALASPQVMARGMVSNFSHPASGIFPALRTPIRFEGFDNPEVGVPPQLGADTHAVLRDELGLTEEEIAALAMEGVT